MSCQRYKSRETCLWKDLEGANKLFLIFYAALFMFLSLRDANLALSLWQRLSADMPRHPLSSREFARAHTPARSKTGQGSNGVDFLGLMSVSGGASPPPLPPPSHFPSLLLGPGRREGEQIET
jgi:hypothetical protein